MNTSSLCIVLALVLCFFSQQARSLDVWVDANSTCTTSCGGQDAPYATLGEALRALTNNQGKVTVRSGVYTGEDNYNLNVTSNSLTLISESGDPDSTVINCQRQGYGLLVQSSTFTMQGFTVRNCEAEYGAGINVQQAYTILRDMKFIANHATKDGGSLWSKSNSLEAYNTTVSASSADRNGGGVYLESANLKLYNSHIEYNSADQAGSQLYCQSAAVQIDRASAINNIVSAECHQCSITYMDGGNLHCSPAGSRVGGASLVAAVLSHLLA